jgi:CBS domain-containing protein
MLSSMEQTQHLAHATQVGGRMVSPLLARGWLDRAAGPERLAPYGREVDMAAARLVRAGNPAGMVTRFVTSIHDGLYMGAARDAEAALGPPPCPYALLVLGSGARRESTLRTDQDHALVLADDPPSGASDWFVALAERLATTLERCGLPRCPGDVMATNPTWRVPLGAWQDRFVRWIEQPDEEALLSVAIFFDFRQVYGDLTAEQPLRRVIRGAAGNGRFLGRLAAAAVRRRPASGLLSHWPGGHHGRVDLKAHGTAPIVDLARLLALEAGRPETGTVARLQAAADQGRAGTAAIGLLDVFDYLQQLRLRHQAACQAAGAPADDVMALSELTTLQRRRLKDAMHLIHICQESLRITYRTDLIA